MPGESTGASPVQRLVAASEMVTELVTSGDVSDQVDLVGFGAMFSESFDRND